MNDELEEIRKDASVVYSRYYPGFCMEERRKIAKNLSQDRRCPYRDSKKVSLESESAALPLRSLSNRLCQISRIANISITKPRTVKYVAVTLDGNIPFSF
jgi:hypothetical protein